MFRSTARGRNVSAGDAFSRPGDRRQRFDGSDVAIAAAQKNSPHFGSEISTTITRKIERGGDYRNSLGSTERACPPKVVGLVARGRFCSQDRQLLCRAAVRTENRRST